MHLLAPAKINLHLRIGPRRADGFHSLLSWMCSVSLFDKLTLEPAAPGAAGGSKPITLTCNSPELAVDESNLVVRVATAFLQAVKSAEVAPPQSQPQAMRASLVKNIPIGAGLGGGSSDGARTLMGLDHLFRTGWSADNLSAFAAQFGSDLSFFIYGPSSVCRGRGEQVTPIDRPRPRSAVLILPGIMMPTAQVYRRFDEMKLGDERAIQIAPDWPAWTTLEAADLLPKLINDLEAPAFAIAPQLGELCARTPSSSSAVRCG